MARESCESHLDVDLENIISLKEAWVGHIHSLMLRILFFIFILLPLLELYVLIEVGTDIGGLKTIALCLFTAALGGFIIRWQGLQTLLNARKSMAQAQHHQLAEHGMHGIMLVLAGVLLFLPGLITDSMGFLLLIPAFRKRLMMGKVRPHAQNTTQSSRYQEVIDVEVIKKD